MTTPNQGAPDGAVTVGGGTWNYGQLIDEKRGRAEFEIEPPSNLFEALELLPVVLNKLPNDSMKPWQKWLGKTDEERSAGLVQNSLVDSLNDHPLRELINQITLSLGGQDGTNVINEVLEEAASVLRRTFRELQENTKAIIELMARRDGTVSRGETITVDFSDYSNMEAAGFAVTYSGSGASTILIDNDVAKWNVADNLSRNAKIIHVTPTATDFQAVRGTMSAPPQYNSGSDKPAFYALARVSPDGQDYVWARAYATTFLGSYKADVGYCIGGTEVPWVTNVPLSWSLNMKFVAGVGTAERVFQLWSGNSVVWSQVESGSTSRLCSAGHADSASHTTSCVKYRQWGAIAQVRNGKTAGRVASAAATDNGTPAVSGSTARMERTATSSVLFKGGGTAQALPASFFDAIVYESVDVDADSAAGSFKVSKACPYILSARVELSAAVSSVSALLLQVSKDAGATWQTVQYGPSIVPSAGESLAATWVQFLYAGDRVRLATLRGGIDLTVLTGNDSGTASYFTIAAAAGGS